MSDELSKMENFVPQQPEENKVKSAFLQVPVKLREQVEAFVEEITAQSDTDWKVSDQTIESLPSQGCFLVISLDKIEEIINSLKSCLSMEPDNGARNIKSEIRRTLTLIN